MPIKVENCWTLSANLLQNLLFYKTNFEKEAKIGKSKRVLKESDVILFKRIYVSASQNNLDYVVGAS